MGTKTFGIYLMMEAASSSETPVPFFQTARCHTSEGNLHSIFHENAQVFIQACPGQNKNPLFIHSLTFPCQLLGLCTMR
jgi:hypothetical protein